MCNWTRSRGTSITCIRHCYIDSLLYPRSPTRGAWLAHGSLARVLALTVALLHEITKRALPALLLRGCVRVRREDIGGRDGGCRFLWWRWRLRSHGGVLDAAASAKSGGVDVLFVQTDDLVVRAVPGWTWRVRRRRRSILRLGRSHRGTLRCGVRTGATCTCRQTWHSRDSRHGWSRIEQFSQGLNDG